MDLTFLPNQSKERSILIACSGTVLVLFTISDLIFHEAYMRSSGKLSVFLQGFGNNSTYFVVWYTVSLFMTFVPPIILSMYTLYAASRHETITNYCLLFATLSTDLFLKVMYGRGRPYLYND